MSTSRGAAKASGPRADVVRGAIEACRLEAREPAGVRLGGGGHAVRAEKIAVGPRRPVTWALAGVSGRTATGWRTNRRWQPAMLRRPWAVATSRIAHLDRRGGGEGAAQAARCAPGSRRVAPAMGYVGADSRCKRAHRHGMADEPA